MHPPPDRPPSEIPTLPPADGIPGRTSLTRLLTLLRHDLRLRWQRGAWPRLEDYLECHPTLRADADAVIDLVFTEFILREELGEAPAVEEYLGRFPEYAERLRELFDLHRAPHASLLAPPSDPAMLAPAAPP